MIDNEHENEVNYFGRLFRSMGVALGVCALAFIVASKIPGLISGLLRSADSIDSKKILDKFKDDGTANDSN